MAEKRKLQIEIDKTMKRVDEGIEEFDTIFTKINATGNQSQKEKLENELKREIKKLQRFRDQIKVWQASSDVKDKMPLDEARRKIEKEMERFKVCEREFKMKAFSKEGLAAKAKVDPHEEERCKHRDWINEIINKLSTSVDQYEAEIEILHNKKGKNKNDNDKVSELQTWVYRHNWHQQKLEQILRRLENDTINMSLLDDIKENIDYYADCHEESEYYFDENFYIDLKLEEAEEPCDSGADLLEDECGNSDGVVQNETEEKNNENKKREEMNKHQKNENISSSLCIADTSQLSSSSTKSSPFLSSLSPNYSSSPLFDYSSKNTTAPLLPPPDISSSFYSSWGRVTKHQRNTHSNSSIGNSIGLSFSSTQASSSILEMRSRSVGGESIRTSNAFNSSSNKIDNKNVSTNIAQDLSSCCNANSSLISSADKRVAEKIYNNENEEEKIKDEKAESEKKEGKKKEVQGGAAGGENNEEINDKERKEEIEKEEHVCDLLNKEKSYTRHNCDFESIECLLESSYKNCPTKNDSEKNKTNSQNRILINQPHQSFPITSLQNHDTEQFFKKIDLDTLFFVFYYQQGTYNQYLAARELKKQSWRFHKKYSTWFQRREEPRITNEKFEQGTYLYFDFENSWSTRVKPDFTFEYQWLEDEVPV